MRYAHTDDDQPLGGLMAHAKIVNYLAYQATRDWVITSLSNDIQGIQVADYGLFCEFRLKGVQQMRTFREFNDSKVYARGFDSLGNEIIFTSKLTNYSL
jgi:hypothetical protein